MDIEPGKWTDNDTVSATHFNIGLSRAGEAYDAPINGVAFMLTALVGPGQLQMSMVLELEEALAARAALDQAILLLRAGVDPFP